MWTCRFSGNGGRGQAPPLHETRKKYAPCRTQSLIGPHPQRRRAHDVRPYVKAEDISQGQPPELPLKAFPTQGGRWHGGCRDG